MEEICFFCQDYKYNRILVIYSGFEIENNPFLCSKHFNHKFRAFLNTDKQALFETTFIECFIVNQVIVYVVVLRWNEDRARPYYDPFEGVSY